MNPSALIAVIAVGAFAVTEITFFIRDLVRSRKAKSLIKDNELKGENE